MGLGLGGWFVDFEFLCVFGFCRWSNGLVVGFGLGCFVFALRFSVRVIAIVCDVGCCAGYCLIYVVVTSFCVLLLL